MLPTEILKLAILGNVDDGKSTLIGKLIYDTGQLPQDTYSALVQDSAVRGFKAANFAFLTDGLIKERELGVTIDNAFKHFISTNKRFMIIDCPGHVEYTHNTLNGLSQARAAVILIDATRRISEQTKRHLLLVSLLRIEYLIICINKMDLVSYSEKHFLDIKQKIDLFLSKLEIKNRTFIPISALSGDNLVVKSPNTPWYVEESLLVILQNLQTTAINSTEITRISLEGQYDSFHYARLESGSIMAGDTLWSPSKEHTYTIKEFFCAGSPRTNARTGQSICFTFPEKVTFKRGEILTTLPNRLTTMNHVEAFLCWVSKESGKTTQEYFLKSGLKYHSCFIDELIGSIDISTYELRQSSKRRIAANEVVKTKIKLKESLYTAPYEKNKKLGSFILINPISNETVALGFIIGLAAN